MKVTFIYPANTSLKSSHFKTMGKIPHMGILSIAGVLQHYGHECSLVDAFNFQLSTEETVKRALEDAPDLFAITSNTSNIVYAMEVARVLKESTDKPIVVGGQHASNMVEQVLSVPAVDYAIVGEGEFSMLELVNALENGEGPKGIAGISYRDHFGEIIETAPELLSTLEDLPPRAWNLINLKDYHPSPGSHIKKPAISTMMQRGCPFGCVFCGVNSIFKHKVKQHSLEFFENELKYFKSQGIVDIQFWDSVFTLSDEWTFAACKLLKKYGFIWNCIGRLDHVSESLLREMKDSGCYEIGYGIESGTQRSLDLMKKKLKLDDISRTIALTKKVGIKAKCFFIVGFPWESREDIMKTFDFAFKLRPHYVAFSICAPYPGAPMWDAHAAHYTTTESFRGIDNLAGRHSVCTSFTVDELAKLTEKMRRKYYINIRYFIEILRSIGSFGEFMHLFRSFLGIFIFNRD